MDKRVYILAGLLVLGGFGYYLSQPKCQKADEVQVQIIQMTCWETHDKTNFKEKLCQELKGSPECKLYQEEDGAAVEAIIMREIQPCVEKQFKANNLCVESK